MTSRLMRLSGITLLGLLLSVAVLAQTDYSKAVASYTVYLGVVPAEIVQGHALPHPEATMHGGAKAAANSHHVMVSIIDRRSGKQLAGAKVSARVGELGMSANTKTLEPMVIAATTTYGNFFSMKDGGKFQIDVEFKAPNDTRSLTTTFYFTHPGADHK